jgi:hypothetical protein
MADEVKLEIQQEPPDLVDLQSSRLKISCPEAIKGIKSSLHASEIVRITAHKAVPENLRKIPRVTIPIELTVKLVAKKGQEKKAIEREIARLTKAQAREMHRVSNIEKYITTIKSFMYDGIGAVCTSEKIELVHTGRGGRL